MNKIDKEAKKIPAAMSIIGTLFILFSIICVLFGVFFLVNGFMTESAADKRFNMNSTELTTLGSVFIAIAFMYFFFGKGLRKGSNSARIAVIVISGLWIAFGILFISLNVMLFETIKLSYIITAIIINLMILFSLIFSKDAGKSYEEKQGPTYLEVIRDNFSTDKTTPPGIFFTSLICKLLALLLLAISFSFIYPAFTIEKIPNAAWGLSSSGLLVFLGILSGLMAVAYFFAGIELTKKKRWARNLAVTLLCCNIILAILFIIRDAFDIVTNVFAIAITLIFLHYLLCSQEAKNFFKK